MPKGLKGFQKGHKLFGGVKFEKGHKIRLGKKHSDESRDKMSKSRRGKHTSPETEFRRKDVTCHELAGGRVRYRTLHTWVTKNLGRPDSCENCGRTGLKGRQIHWASKTNKYKKELNDWIRLCVKCHYEKDRKGNNRNSIK